MNKAQVAGDLRGGARYIRKHGWTQGCMADSDGMVCAMGGIRGHLGTLGDSWQERDMEATAAFAKYLKPDEEPRLEILGRVQPAFLRIASWATSIVADWNDEQAKDGDEVIERMEKAAAWVEEQA